MRPGDIIEIDRTHLPVARKLRPTMRRFGARVESVSTDDGWQYVLATVGKTTSRVLVAVPAPGDNYFSGRGPKVRKIR